MPNESNRPDVAVFIDFENVYVSVRDKLDANPNFESIMDRCADFGRVVIARAYADWYRYPRITSALYANGIEPMYVPTYYYDREMGRTGRAIKNSVDMNLCVDAMKTLFTNPNIAKFVLATGDRDFIPLVNTIRQQGKEVIVIGIGGAASAHLAQSADEFIFYEQLVGKQPNPALHQDQPRARMPEKGREYEQEDEPTPQPAQRGSRDSSSRDSAPRDSAPRDNAPRDGAPRDNAPREAAPEREAVPDIYDTLVRAIHLARERGYVCSFGSLKLLMKELMGGEFKEGKYKDVSGKPFAKFKDFVQEAERRGKVQVFTNGTVNEVFLPGEDPYQLSQFAQELKEEPSSLLPLPAPSLEDRDGRNGVSNGGGRRRRRRPRDRQRQGLPPLLEVTLPPDEEYEPPIDDLAFAPPDAVLAPDFPDDGQAEAVFNSLLEQIEQEDASANASLNELAAIEEIDVLPDLEDEEPAPAQETAAADEPPAEPPPAAPTPEPAAEPAPAPSPVPPEAAAVEALAQTLDRPFEEAEWHTLRAVVGTFDRPASFAQIHDALRDARNRTQINRTNEELRSLIKQAINSGVLARIGKGNRISYRLAPNAEALVAEVVAHPQPVEETSEAETPSQVELIEQTALAEAAAPSAEAVEAPEAVALAVQEETAAPAEEPVDVAAPVEPAQAPAETVEAPAAEAAPAVETPAAELGAPEVSETPAAPPAAEKPARSRSSRRRKPTAAAEPEAPPAVEVAPEPVAEAPAEAPAPPAKRTRRRTKASTPEAEPQQ
jgi:uncharacterized protein (TIGR00288 family)